MKRRIRPAEECMNPDYCDSRFYMEGFNKGYAWDKLSSPSHLYNPEEKTLYRLGFADARESRV